MLRTSIVWKAAAGLALDDEGFHPTVLVLWRNKLRASERPERIFEAVREVVNESGVIAKRNRRALDSTVLDDAVQRQDTISLLQSQIRRVAKARPRARRSRLRARAQPCARPPAVRLRGSRRRRPPDLRARRGRLRAGLAAEDLGLELDQQQQEAVALLALLAGQDVEPGERARHLADRPSGRSGPHHLHGRPRVAATPTRPSIHTVTATRRTWPPSPTTGIITATKLTGRQHRGCRGRPRTDQRRTGRHRGPRRRPPTARASSAATWRKRRCPPS